MRIAGLVALLATCTPTPQGDPPPAKVVDPGPNTGDPGVCQAACDHLQSMCGEPATCLQTCLSTWGTNIGAVVDWTCISKATDPVAMQGCGVNVCTR